MLTLVTLDLSDALKLQGHVLALAAGDGGDPISSCIVDARAQLLTATSMPGATPLSARAAHAKAVSAVLTGKDTREIRHTYDEGVEEWVLNQVDGWTDPDVAAAQTLDPTFCPWSGGLVIDRSVLRALPVIPVAGGLGISGRSELGDHQLGTQALLDSGIIELLMEHWRELGMA